MVTTRTKSTSVQRSVVDQAIRVLAMLPDRSGQKPSDSSVSISYATSSNGSIQK